MTLNESWTDEQIQEVWEKGNTVQGFNSDQWRKDDCTAWIYRKRYGKRNSDYGWEVDHIDSDRDNNSVANLRPLQWDNNASRACVVKSSENTNVREPKN